MNLATTLVYAYGTHEGVLKEWETRDHGAFVLPRGRMKLERIQRELHAAGAAKKLVMIEYEADDTDKAKSYILEPYSWRGDKFFGYDTVDKSIKAFKAEKIIRVSPLGKTYKPRWDVEV